MSNKGKGGVIAGSPDSRKSAYAKDMYDLMPTNWGDTTPNGSIAGGGKSESRDSKPDMGGSGYMEALGPLETTPDAPRRKRRRSKKKLKTIDDLRKVRRG